MTDKNLIYMTSHWSNYLNLIIPLWWLVSNFFLILNFLYSAALARQWKVLYHPQVWLFFWVLDGNFWVYWLQVVPHNINTFRLLDYNINVSELSAWKVLYEPQYSYFNLNMPSRLVWVYSRIFMSRGFDLIFL